MVHEVEKSPARGARAVIQIPVATVDGTAAIAAWLNVSGNGEENVTLEFGAQKITVSAGHLYQALNAIGMIAPRGGMCCPPPPPPPMMMR